MDVFRFFHPSDSSPKVESWLATADPSLRQVDLVIKPAGTVQTFVPSTPLQLPITYSVGTGSERSFRSQQVMNEGTVQAMRMGRAVAPEVSLATEVKHEPPPDTAAAISAGTSAVAAVGLGISVRFSCNVCGLDGWLIVDARDTAVKYCPACGMIQRWK